MAVARAEMIGNMPLILSDYRTWDGFGPWRTWDNHDIWMEFKSSPMSHSAWRRTEDIFSFPLTKADNLWKTYDLSAGSILLILSYDKHAKLKYPFIWGIKFVKSSFTQAMKIKLKMKNLPDQKNVFGSNTWLNPDNDASGDFLEMEFSSSDMDEGGCIYFTKISDPNKVIHKHVNMLLCCYFRFWGSLQQKYI